MYLVEYVALYWDEEGDEGEIVKIWIYLGVYWISKEPCWGSIWVYVWVWSSGEQMELEI